MGRNKLESITLRVSAEFKRQVITQARAQNHSMTTYLEWLVMQDSATTRAEQRDAYQEALDLCAYLRQALYERDGR